MAHKNTKPEAGFGIVEVIVMLCILAAIVFAGWYIWHENRKDATSNKAVPSDGQSFEASKDNKPIFTGAENQDGQPLLKLSQWGVEVPLTDKNKDLLYRYEKNGDEAVVTFTFTSLQQKDVCTNDVGVRLTRETTENEPPFNIDNPQSFKKLGTYFYYVAYSDKPCYDVNKSEEVAAVTQVAGAEDIKQFVVNSLKDLRITDN